MHDIAARLRPALGEPAFVDASCLLYACEHRVLADAMRTAEVQADAMVVDAPYSKRTHAGHDGGAAQANGDDDRWTRSNGRVEKKVRRRDLGYPALAPEDVVAFVATWNALVDGWFVSLTDDILASHWRAALEAGFRLGFQSVPCCIGGMTVRLVGDGPSSEAVHAVVARPRREPFSKWGTLRGYYEGPAERCPWVGGKPVWLVRALVRDYSRPDDLIVDPCCGAATLGVAIRHESRRAIMCDRDPVAVETSAKRLRGERTKSTRDDFPETEEQPSLFAARTA